MTAVRPRFVDFLDGCLRYASGRILAQRDRSASVKAGDPNQVVTAADRAVGAALVARIRTAYPDAGVIDEESGAVPGTSGQVWLVDPVDGSSNYAAGSPLYGSMLAVVEDGRPVAGGVVLPAFGARYTAEVGYGVHRNGRPVPPVPPRPLAESLVAYGLDTGPPEQLSADWELLAALAQRVRGLRGSNSVFDAVMVLTGAYAAVIHRRMRIWDVAPIHALVTAAGGACLGLDGAPLDWSDPLARVDDVFAVTITAPGLAGEVQAITAPFADIR